ncbi:hypothetical protein [Streptomyces noursei]|uniref:hypothetical protein n=1 Tax=Streptomyces noursei TaxID=1971 RepID=UPI0011AF9808|nr:hypothetical protein [Streptomyces noursei]
MSEGQEMRWSWTGLIALILAVGVSIALCVSLIIVALSIHPISQQFAGVLSALSGATVGALATYLGGTRGGKPPDLTQESKPEIKK